MGTVVRFLFSIAFAAVLVSSSCSADYVCPTGTASSNGRCQLLPLDTVDSAIFTWPPRDTRDEVGMPPPFTPPGQDARSDSTASDIANADAAAMDAATSDAAPSDSAEAGDGAGAEVAGADAREDTAL